ncbi:MAG: hypothetical protein IT162_03775 [Bryobacterales bacterium]|nr:hypothetical protein [Bryobacterales bacterium]
MGIALAQWRTYGLPCLAAGALQTAATLFLPPEWAAALCMIAAFFVTAILAEAHFDTLSGQHRSLRESTVAALSQAGTLAVLLVLAGLIAAPVPRSYWGEVGSWLLLPWIALAIPSCVLEHRSVWACLRRGVELTTGSRVRAILFLLLAIFLIQRTQYRSTEGWMGHWGVLLFPIATAYCAAAVTACYQSLNAPYRNQN